MRLKEEFVTVLNGDDYVTVSTDTQLFSGIIRSNSTASFILSCLEEETDVDTIVGKLLEKYDVEKTVVRIDVEGIIEKLRSINALYE